MALRASADQDDSIKLFGTNPEKSRWLLVILGMAINLCLGSIYSWAVFVQPVTDYFTAEGFHVTANQALMPFSVFLAVFSIMMLLGGKLIEKYGPRKVCLVGGVLTGLGWALSSLAPSPALLNLSYGLLGGVGGGIAYGCPIAVSAKWFPDRSGLAVGLTVFGFGFSAFFTANIAGYLIPAFGLMGAFRIIGISLMIIIALLSAFLVFPPQGWSPANRKAKNTLTRPLIRQYTREEMARTPSFYSLWLCYFLGAFSGLTAIGISHEVGVEIIGINPGQATLMVGSFAIFNACGRPAFGFILDRFRPRGAAMLCFSLIGLASLALFFAGSGNVVAFLAAFSILWGCYGGWVAIAGGTTAEFFGTKDYPRCFGVVFLASGVGALIGPQIAGLIKEQTDSYLEFFPILAIIAVLGFLVAFFTLKSPASGEDGRMNESKN
jgi:MFS transporter, OFA family, oxalate/formate antiporter